MTRRLDIGVYGVRGVPSTYSGFETFLTTLLPALVARGHDVTIYCRSGSVGGAPAPYEGVQRRPLPSVRTKQLDTLSHGLLAGVAARVARHEVVLVCNAANAPYCLAARATGQRLILNTDGQEWLRGKWGRGARWYFRTCARSARFAAAALIADCAAMQAIYLERFGAESTVIPYCWPGGPEPEGADIDVPSGPPYFVTGGRLVPENNIERIAAAYCTTDLDHPLLVLGDANYRSPVQRALRGLADQDPRVRLLGHIADRAGWFRLLRGARAYLHGHSVGGMNPSLVEAMGAGAIVAALGTPFNREVLGKQGIYFDDVRDELPTVLRWLARLDDDTQTSLRAAYTRRARERFDRDAVVDAYEDLFVRVADASPFATVTVDTRWASD